MLDARNSSFEKCWKNSILFLSFWQKSTHIKKNLYTVLCTRYKLHNRQWYAYHSKHVDLQNPFKYQTSYYKIYDKYRKEIWPSRCTISLNCQNLASWHPYNYLCFCWGSIALQIHNAFFESSNFSPTWVNFNTLIWKSIRW